MTAWQAGYPRHPCPRSLSAIWGVFSRSALLSYTAATAVRSGMSASSNRPCPSRIHASHLTFTYPYENPVGCHGTGRTMSDRQRHTPTYYSGSRAATGRRRQTALPGHMETGASPSTTYHTSLLPVCLQSMYPCVLLGEQGSGCLAHASRVILSSPGPRATHADADGKHHCPSNGPTGRGGVWLGVTNPDQLRPAMGWTRRPGRERETG